MGFFSKVFKGVKKVFKKVGKAIKSGLKSVGKFMDKIGIVGQIGLSLLLPGIGAALSSGWGSLVQGLSTYSGFGSSVVKAAGGFLKTATEIAGRVGKAFNSVTSAVKNVVGETLKFGAQKLGLGNVATKLGTTFGSQTLTDLGTSISNASFDNITNAFGEGFKNITDSFSNVFNPDPNTLKTPVAEMPAGEAPSALQTQGDLPIEKGFKYDPNSLLQETPPAATLADEAAISSFEAARDAALNTEIKGVGEGNFVYEKMQEVQTGLGKKLGEKYEAFKKDPVGVTAGFVGEKFEEGVGAGVKRRGIELVAGDMTPDVTQRIYSMHTPNIDYVNVEPASLMDINFFNNNQDIINSYPIGASAVAYENAYYQDLDASYRGVKV